MLENYIDNEDYFGFHSEYYINPEWRNHERSSSINREAAAGKGYMKFTVYKNNIYFLSHNGKFVIQCNPTNQKNSVIMLDANENDSNYEYSIAVNRQGIFLYDMQTITLFKFDGQKIYSYKYSPTKKTECIYIYDSKVFYSDTKTVGNSSALLSVDMITKKVDTIWSTEKGDTIFDNQIRKAYLEQWKNELPFFPAPSNIGNISCEFLYANGRRILAGYTRCKGDNKISYIVNVDLVKKKWDFIDCFAIGHSKYHLPSKNDRHIFSFDMLKDIMWVKGNGEAIKLAHMEIKKVSEITGQYAVGYILVPLSSHIDYYFFDGVKAYIPETMELYAIKDGNKKSISYHPYQSRMFFVLNDWYYVPSEYGGSFYSINDKLSYTLNRNDIEELVNHAKATEESHCKTKSPYTIIEHNTNLTYENEKIEKINVQKNEPVKEPFHTNTSKKIVSKLSQDLQALINTANSDEELIEQLKAYTSKNTAPTVNEDISNNPVFLADFRLEAPLREGFRDKLIAYRKSLSNSWDYNTYVGILLGVSGPKHGDAACMNYAIGQGDNGNNTKKTLEARGLMSVFEKYKGKKLDTSITLSDVEDEIVAIVPEYAKIRHKFHEIIG